MKWTSYQNNLFNYLEGLVPTRVIADALSKSRGAVRSKRRRRVRHCRPVMLPGDVMKMPWITSEKEAVKTLRAHKIPYSIIANRIGRTTKAVRRFMEKLT